MPIVPLLDDENEWGLDPDVFEAHPDLSNCVSHMSDLNSLQQFETSKTFASVPTKSVYSSDCNASTDSIDMFEASTTDDLPAYAQVSDVEMQGEYTDEPMDIEGDTDSMIQVQAQITNQLPSLQTLLEPFVNSNGKTKTCYDFENGVHSFNWSKKIKGTQLERKKKTPKMKYPELLVAKVLSEGNNMGLAIQIV